MKNILVKNSLKSILMSVLILFVIPATNSTLAFASLRKDCDEKFEAGFWGDETPLGQPNEHPESKKADGSNSKNKLFFTSLYDRSEAERDKYFPLRQILLKRQNEKQQNEEQQNEEQEKLWYTDYSHLFRNESQ